MKINKNLEIDEEKVSYDRLTDDEKELISDNDIKTINRLSNIDGIDLIDVMNRKNTPPYNYIILCSIKVSKNQDPIYYDIDKIDESHTLKIPDYVTNEIKEEILDAINRPVIVRVVEIY